MSLRKWLAAVLLAVSAAPSQAQAPSPSPGSEAVRKIIVFRRSVTPANRIRILEATGGKLTHDLRLISAVGVTFPAKQYQAAQAGLLASPEILRIEDDYEQNWLRAAAPAPVSLEDIPFPAVRDFLLPHGIRPLKNADDPEQPWGIGRVGAPAAWAVTKGAGAKVAVIDTGIDFNHPDLAANVKGGWSAVDKENPKNFLDDNGHGTHVSGTIAAIQNSTGVVGVAPEASLYGVKVLNGNGSGTYADVIAGMQWAADNKMDIASMSLGASRGTPALAEAVTAVTKAGTVIIAAAGNSSGAVGYPAAYPECVAISASDSRDALAYFSSRGPEVDLIAPGVDVNSTYMGGGYDTLSGTSMATPHVSGLAALLVAAKGTKGEPAIRAGLQAAAKPIEGLKPEEQGAGMVDAGKLVR